MNRDEWNEKLIGIRRKELEAHASDPPYRIAVYMTAHGWGHMTRMLRVVVRLARNPAFTLIWIVADFKPSMLRKMLERELTPEQMKKFTFSPHPLDFGLIQRDSVTTDWELSRKNAREWLDDWDEIVFQEARWLRTWFFNFILSDMPAIPIEAARWAEVPAYAMGNFTWDWIYNELPDLDDVWVELAFRCRKAYECGDVWFRLPFTQPGAGPGFAIDYPVGLLAQPGRNRRFELAAATGAAVRKPWVLLAFTALDWNGAIRKRVAGDLDAEFFVVPPLRWSGRLPSNFRRVPENMFPYSDLVATCDVVLTKPGFGIFSDCVVNEKPVVFSQRPEFPESEILSRDIHRFGVGVEVKRGDFYAGEVGESIQKALDAPWEPPEEIPNNGVAAITNALWLLTTTPPGWKPTDVWTPPPVDWGNGPEPPFLP